MSTRRFVLVVTLGIAAIALWWFGRPGRENDKRPHSTSRNTSPSPQPIPTLAPIAVAPATPENEEPPFEGIEHLNSPDRTIHQDLGLLNDVFFSWQTNFPRQGNPVGSNEEITAALTGQNRLRLAMIPRKHPAINAKGELMDRWGTPFYFHQLSGSKMEIRSAGPDRKLFSADDEVLTP